jgi:diguanylate cyclase (GGDEF)-like protein
MLTRWELAASTDYLTGLANRRSVVLAGNRAFLAAQRHHTAISVAVIDVDHFKNINDRFGHDVGDLALKHIVTVLESIGRKTDLLGRFGGEEFVVLLEQTNQEQASVIAQRMRLAIQNSVFDLSGYDTNMTVSIGLATIQESDRSFDNLVQRADKALYSAKALGRNRVEFADPLTTIST